MKTLESRLSFHFQTRLMWDNERHASALVDGKPALQVSSPPEFKGDPARWSPEDMLVAAVDACLLMTFLAYSKREELDLVRYESGAEGVLEFSNGRYRYTDVTLRPHVAFRTEEDAEIAHLMLEEAHRDCIIANSITATVKLEPEISVVVAP